MISVFFKGNTLKSTTYLRIYDPGNSFHMIVTSIKKIIEIFFCFCVLKNSLEKVTLQSSATVLF